MTAAPATRIEPNGHDDHQMMPAAQAPTGGMMDIATTRAAQEVQAAMVIAKNFPRDTNAAYTKIMQACKRPRLAEQALYAYPRGGQVVTGPSIRLAEELARDWGNLDFGIIELEQSGGESTCMSYCWDLETNTRQTKIFTVKHERHTKRGVSRLTDPRDIYEMTANQGARRLRACILGVIPGDITDDAVAACEKTLDGDSEVPMGDRIRKMLAAFYDLGVSQEMVEKRVGHNIEATTGTELVNLQKIYRSLRDNMASVADFFDVPKTASEKTDKLNDSLNGGGDAKPEPGPKAETKPKAENKPPKYQVLIDLLAGTCDCTNENAEAKIAAYAANVLGVTSLDKLTAKQITDTKKQIRDGSITVT